LFLPRDDRADHTVTATRTTISRSSYVSSKLRGRRYTPGGAHFRCDRNSTGRWSTFVKSNCIGDGKCVHPGYTNNKAADQWVQMLASRAHEKGYDRVLYLYHIATPSTEGGTHDIFRCHPEYGGSPWHDWCLVNFENNDGKYSTAAKVLLWGMFVQQDEVETLTTNADEMNSTSSQVPERPLFAVIHPFKTNGPPPADSVLPFGSTDVLAKDVCDVDFDTIESVTYILPINKKRTDAFPKTTDDESAFLVIPPRSKWDQLCWDNKLLDEWR